MVHLDNRTEPHRTAPTPITSSHDSVRLIDFRTVVMICRDDTLEFLVDIPSARYVLCSRNLFPEAMAAAARSETSHTSEVTSDGEGARDGHPYGEHAVLGGCEVEWTLRADPGAQRGVGR